MAKLRVAINGFGRTGRCLIRQIYDNNILELVAINNRSPLRPTLLIDDSIYGKFGAKVGLDEKIKPGKKHQVIEKYLHIDKQVIPVFEGDEPIACPWDEVKADIVVDATGNFPKLEWIIDHCKAGAKNVVMTYPPSNKEIKTIMVGVNEQLYDPTKDHILSAGSSTAMALAPLVKYVDAEWGIEHCFYTTTHCYTDSQNLLDNTNKDLWRSRAAGLNIIPTTTGAEQTIPAMFPHLDGKIVGMANRVPVFCGSQLLLTLGVKKEITTEEVHTYFTRLVKNEALALLDLCSDPAYSLYFRGNPHAAVLDMKWTYADKKKLRLVAWFDNEWGYCARLVALLECIASKTKKKWF